MNEKEKKAIEELSKKAVICNYEERDYPSMICFKKDMLIALNLIEKLQKENEELNKENEHNKLLLNLNNNFTIDKKNGNYKWNVIEIQKIKDKIKELNSRIEIYWKYVQQGIETDVEWVDNVADIETVKVLQSLLEKE